MPNPTISGVALFANQPQTTVATGGTAALSQGASEQWTVGSSASFPPASISAVPATSFCVADTASTSEIIMVTAVTGTVWGVTRGAESTTPVTHATGFTIQQVVTAGELNNFQQMRNGGNTVPSTITTSGTIGSYSPPVTDVPAAGVVYDFAAFGTFSNSNATTLFQVQWNGTTLATASSALNGTLGTKTTSGNWWIEGKIHCYGATTMVSGFNFQGANSSATHTISTMVGCSPAGNGVTTTGSTGPLTILASASSWTLITQGVLIHRIS